MNAGSLNRRITIQQQSTSQDAYGQQLASWTDALSTWASIRAATGKEIYAASGFVSELSHIITIRYPAIKVSNAMRVLYDNRIFNIQAVSDPDEGKVQTNLLCLEVDASA
ncbi:phage head closure protein [Granulicella cerasi]|uniref:Phage head closure protein n=1 Tax=Granulicella cerasi TaxID=741063 RepID=A0ABW1Z425_9BACT|nr:phage head closure protein [Granulicella cerasi]